MSQIFNFVIVSVLVLWISLYFQFQSNILALKVFIQGVSQFMVRTVRGNDTCPKNNFDLGNHGPTLFILFNTHTYTLS